MVELTLVNEQGKPYGYAESDIVHKKNMRHLSIHGLVLNKKGELLVRKISENSPFYPGYWSTGIGAHVPYNSTVERASQRICQVLGFTYENVETLGSIYVQDDFEHEVSPVIILYGETLPQAQGAIVEFKYLSPKEIKKLSPQTPHLSESLKLYEKWSKE